MSSASDLTWPDLYTPTDRPFLLHPQPSFIPYVSQYVMEYRRVYLDLSCFYHFQDEGEREKDGRIDSKMQ